MTTLNKCDQMATGTNDVPPYRSLAVLDRLADLPAVEIAVDTEYEGPHTLTVQAAARICEDIVVQVYHSQDVPTLPRAFRITNYLPRTQYQRFCRRVVLRPVQRICSAMSPADILLDLLGLGAMASHNHTIGRWILDGDAGWICEPFSGRWNDSRKAWDARTIHVRLVGHFLTADLGRVFGSDFQRSMFGVGKHTMAKYGPPAPRPFVLQHRKLLRITSNSEGFCGSPMVQVLDSYAGDLYRIVLETWDTMLPFGHASLERHCQTFLGFGKSNAISVGDKERMLATFRAQTADAYGYAIADAVNTLLLHEQMRKEHERIYTSFGVARESIPGFRPTMGSRISDFLIEMVAQYATGSHHLRNQRHIKRLFKAGGCRLFRDDPRTSVFGTQTAGTHGGLLFTRSPTVFWHEAHGQLRDVDMSGCYNRIIAAISLYCGRPVVYEPGDAQLSLGEAAAWAEKHAAPDAWMVRVTGDMATAWNSLIPSTLDARTNATLRHPRRQGCVKQSAKLFSKRIESGIVTSATWTLIRSLPRWMRQEYEELTAETIVLYPRKLVADTAVEYDQLVDQHQHERLGWESILDVERLQKTDIQHLDHRYVAMRFPIKDVARRLVEMREQAKAEFGKGSGAEQSLKLQANSMYGVLASGFLPTQNVVAANIITATARANAWIIAMVLNGIQTITDGTTYRRDQIPACSFQECLRRCPDYPLRRPDRDEIPFLDPAEVPGDDAAFTIWLRSRAKWFFETSDAAFDKLVSLPILEHKRTGETGDPAFDAMACDGCGDYVKYTVANEEYMAHEVAMRGYGPKCREAILHWILTTYATDRVNRPCPIVVDRPLFTLDRAQKVARKAFRNTRDEVYLPLGLPDQRPLAFKAIKLSAFIFRSPSQLKRLSRQEQRFVRRTACGLELLCLRRKYRSGGPSRLSEFATRVYKYIQQDGGDLTKKFHLRRLSKKQVRVADERTAQMERLRGTAERELQATIDARNFSKEASKTGIFVQTMSPLLAR